MTADPLINYLFDDKPHRLSGIVQGWLAASPRYKVFATTYKDKIRKKIRITRDGENIEDLRFELAIGYWLAQEKRFGVVYEPYASSKTRGPDYAINFKSFTFNVEVTRIRPVIEREEEGDKETPARPGRQGDKGIEGRLADTVADKLSQMLPGMMNVLVVGVEEAAVPLLEVDKVMARLRERVERKDEVVLKRHRFEGTADFFKVYLRLSGILVKGVGDGDTAWGSVLWLNNQAKHAIPAKLKTILQE